jgi:hypothetical protein
LCIQDHIFIRGGRHDGILGTVVSGLRGTVASVAKSIDRSPHYRVELNGRLGFVSVTQKYYILLPELQQVNLVSGVALTVVRGEMQMSDASGYHASGSDVLGPNAMANEAIATDLVDDIDYTVYPAQTTFMLFFDMVAHSIAGLDTMDDDTLDEILDMLHARVLYFRVRGAAGP